MGEVRRYPHGTFCWVDIGTTDPAGAKAFYSDLFGWETEDMPAEGGVYTLCRLDGKDVAAIHEHGKEEGSHWSSYLCVDDADEATARARELGAEVLREPFDIPGAARMSLIRDPAGADVSLWQPQGHVGAGLVNEVGTWCWNELSTPELDAGMAFYLGMFGWTGAEADAPIRRATFTMGELLIGGAHVPPGEPAHPRWEVSFRVTDVDRTVERVGSLGGRVLLPPMDIPIGRFAIVADPAGAGFTVTSFAAPFNGVDGR